MSTDWKEPEMVDAIYQTAQTGATPFVSRLYDKNGRRMVVGNFANGDIVRVPVADVIAAPASFKAPCGKPYTVSGMTVVNPCNDEVSDEGLVEPTTLNFTAPVKVSEARKHLAGMFGSEKAADALLGAGFATAEAVGALDDEALTGIVGKAGLRAYHKYLADTALEEGGLLVNEEKPQPEKVEKVVDKADVKDAG